MGLKLEAITFVYPAKMHTYILSIFYRRNNLRSNFYVTYSHMYTSTVNWGDFAYLGVTLPKIKMLITSLLKVIKTHC